MFKTNIRKTLAVMVTATVCAAYADAVKVRLQFVFDAGAMDYISQAGANYDDFAASCVTRMNTVLANSRLNGYFTYELAGTTLLPGVDNTNPATGYTEGWAALNGNRGNEWAGMLQDRYNNAADVVVLLINTGTYAGATGNSHPYTGTGAEYAINYAGSAFSVCSIMTAAREIEGIASAHQVLSHEVAHTIGCGHPDTQDRQPGPQSATYAAGLQFKLPSGKETALPRSASVTRDLTAYYGTTLMGYSERFFKNADGTYMTRAEVLAETGWTDADEGEKYWDNTDGSYGTGYPNGVWVYCYIVPYFSSPNLYFSTVTVPYGQEVTSGVVTVYDQTQYDAMSAADKAKVVPMGDATHNNRQVLIDNCQYASKWHLGVKFSKDGNESVVNGKSDKITLTPLSKNLSIYYTTDGAEPTKSNGTLYTAPFSLTQAATVKARSYDANDNAGDVLSKSYTMLPLATALGNTELTWTTTSPEWYANNGVARSGNIGSDGVSSTLSTVIKGPAKLTFDYVAELMDDDVFTVTVGGNEVFRHTGYQSAQTPSGEIVIPAGDQTVEFICTVNFSMGYGMNHVNLYDVAVTYDYDPEDPEDPDNPDNPENPGVAAPVPAAVWENDFSSGALAGFDGFSIEDWQQTHGENNSSVTIDRNNQGLFVDFTEAKGYVTVLVKYSNLSASPSLKRVLFATTANSNYGYDRCGLRLLTDSTVQGLWNTQTASNNDADYGSASTGTVPSAGTLAFVYDKTSGSDAGGLSAYAAGSGESLSDAALWSHHALKAGDIYGFAVGGMCRNASASGAEAAKGMTITGIAVFTNVLTVAEMNAYIWPSEVPQYEGPAPTAVWVAGEFGDDRSAHAGLDVSLNGNTTNAMGQIVIGGSTAGATIALPAATHQKMSMLVKYSIPSGGAPAANAVPAAMLSTHDIGARAAQAASSALDGYWLNGSTVAGGYDFSTPAQTMPQEGYIFISNWATNANPDNHGTAVYTGETLATLSGGEKSGLRFTGADHYITSVGIGGPTVAGAVPWSGMVIKGVALFDEWVTTNVIANYTFPAQGAVIPEDADTLSIASGATWKFAAGETKTYTNIGTLNAGGTIAVTNAATLMEGAYKLAEWTTPQIMSSGYGRVGTLTTEGLPAGLTAELVYGVKAIYLRVYDAAAYAARPKLRIMPYGDSITEGFNLGDSKANYRVLLGQKLALLGYNVEMVGCYNKIQSRYGTDTFFDAIDPSGVAATNIWQWHSAKHGATLGVTALTSYQRSALTENVDTICAQAGRPDAVLLLGGINDLSPGFDAPATVFANWTNVVTRLVTNLPDSKIIVTTTLHAGPGRTDSLNSNADGFNTLVKNCLSSMPAGWVGHVEFVDLCDVVKSAETGVISSDNLHPDWLGDDQMAEGWLSVITNVYPSANGTFPSATPLPTVAASELGAAAKSELAGYRAGFKLCRTITPTANIDMSNPYSATGEGATEDFEKVAYFVEYVRADNNAHKWVWVDMDAFGDADLASVGLPAANRQQVVTKLHVKSNHNGIEDVAADDDTVSGWIEFSPFGYGGAASGVSGAPTAHGGNDKSMYDWNDTLTSGGTYGSMQVFRTAPSTGRPAQVLFAYNNWRDATSEAEFGIGNFAQHFWGGAQTLDYTYTKGLPQMNASVYSVKRIEIWTKTAEPENPDERDLTAEEIAGGKTLTRLNGKVYCGNDANRAVITNYLSQMEGTRPLTPPAPHTVDLLIVFDKLSADYALGTGVTLEEFAARNVAKMNYILTRTDIDTNVWFRLAGVYPIEATAANHTDAMSKGQQSSAPGWEMVHAARDRVGADVVISLYHGAEGMAYRCTPAGIKSGSEAAWAFCGVGHSDINATRGWTWVHEVAHTASLYHNIAGAVGNNDPYYVGCGFGATIGGKWCSTVMNYEPTEDAFSSANHKLNGEIYSITNSAGAYLDASGVLAELLPYMANYRATVVPEGVVVKATPLDEAIVASGATMTLSCNDPDATIYYYNASLGETEANAVEYSAPVAITPGNPLLGMAQYYVFAKKNGVKVTAADAIIDYKVAGSMLVPDNPAEILDMSGLCWSVGDGWTKTTEQSCKGGSAYVCAPSAAATCSLKTTITIDADKTLVFHHIDNFAEGASFVVWVDDMPVWYKKGVNSSGGKWVEDSVFLAQGSHTIEFAFTGNGSTLYLDYLSLDRFTTTTGFPVPYSWIEACFPGIEGYPAAMYETMAKSSGTNGYPYWESYVLGLEPTNALSRFTATIRMEGQKPIVEYSPTNEVLKASGAIEYILQGKPVLSNSWQNVTFEDPGTTNRFFRVKVTW